MAIVTITRPERQKIISDIKADADGDIILDDAASDSDNEGDLSKVNVGTVNNTNIVTPGELVTDETTWMRGHGTYSKDDKTYSSVAGSIVRVNKLLSVKPLRGRYIPVIGEHVVGRVTEVGNKRWKVHIGANQEAVLMLGSVNLPGGVLRRKSETDELQMRKFLKEGDLLNAEVQSLYADGSASLHTRSLRYGKLRNGYFLSVPSSLIIRSKLHSYHLPDNIDCILGVNGYIWLSKRTKASAAQTNNVSITRLEEEAGLEIYSDVNEEISNSTRQAIARYVNCIQALAYKEVGINEARIVATYEASLAYKNAGELIENEVKQAIVYEALGSE
ncbi:hypothetical protein DV495_003852 [Geotrichum candidum]|nr:hypothetical protein DV495_003852 [Geotrichum candidum]